MFLNAVFQLFQLFLLEIIVIGSVTADTVNILLLTLFIKLKLLTKGIFEKERKTGSKLITEFLFKILFSEVQEVEPGLYIFRVQCQLYQFKR